MKCYIKYYIKDNYIKKKYMSYITIITITK